MHNWDCIYGHATSRGRSCELRYQDSEVAEKSNFRVNADILALLKPGSEILSDVEDSFEALRVARGVDDGWRVNNVSCFHEDHELPGIGKVCDLVNQL